MVKCRGWSTPIGDPLSVSLNASYHNEQQNKWFRVMFLTVSDILSLIWELEQDWVISPLQSVTQCLVQLDNLVTFGLSS